MSSNRSARVLVPLEEASALKDGPIVDDEAMRMPFRPAGGMDETMQVQERGNRGQMES